MDHLTCGSAIKLKNARKIGAEGGSRTRTPLRTTDFKSVASAIPPPRHVAERLTCERKRAHPALQKCGPAFTCSVGWHLCSARAHAREGEAHFVTKRIVV